MDEASIVRAQFPGSSTTYHYSISGAYVGDRITSPGMFSAYATVVGYGRAPGYTESVKPAKLYYTKEHRTPMNPPLPDPIAAMEDALKAAKKQRKRDRKAKRLADERRAERYRLRAVAVAALENTATARDDMAAVEAARELLNVSKGSA